MPIISLEGERLQTDERRGRGVYEQAKRMITRLKSAGVLCGVSFTLTRENLPEITDKAYIKKLYSAGARVFFFIEYVPISSGTENLVLTQNQQNKIIEVLNRFRTDFPVSLSVFPGMKRNWEDAWLQAGVSSI